jgi:hypothetical protein
MPNEKLPVGRPKKNLDVLPDEWQKTVIEMYTYGASDVEIRAYLDISDDLFYRWLKDEPVFNQIISIGRKSTSTKGIIKTKKHLISLSNRRKNRNYKKEYQDNKIAYSQRSLLAYHLKRMGAKKSKKTFEYFGYTPSELWENIKNKLQPGMTIENYGKWHVDHIKPLSKFDLSNPREIKKAWAFDNLQPLWAFDNLQKGNRYEPTNKIQS